jgi:UV DNA damage endonuclease
MDGELAVSDNALRFGLCCQFLDQPVRFRTATHRYVSGLSRGAGRRYLGGIARDNADALVKAVETCHALGIGAFRINSQFLPLCTHPRSGYTLREIDSAGEIRGRLEAARVTAAHLDVRLSFHPDQFVVLNSESGDVVASSIRELDAQAELAEAVGADTIVLHAGSLKGGVSAALARLERGVRRLGDSARARLALENDDRLFTPSDLLPLCTRLGLPLVYDVHHHRCHPDGLSVEEATNRAAATWREREPWVHLSSPRDGWKAANPRPHADRINPADFPDPWRGRAMTLDVEAKDKERAVLALKRALGRRRSGVRTAG